jgi:hypothetical protein
MIVNTVVTCVLCTGCAVLETRGAVVACQAADTATTLHAVSLGAREANPVVEWLLETTGPGGFIAAKVAVTLLFLKYYPDISSDLVILVNGLTCGVAAHNLYVIYKLENPPEPDEPEPEAPQPSE